MALKPLFEQEAIPTELLNVVLAAREVLPQETNTQTAQSAGIESAARNSGAACAL